MKMLTGTCHTNELLIWDPHCLRGGYEILAFCKGCRDNHHTFTMAQLDGFVQVPSHQRNEAIRELKGSVGCPMPGKSHRVVEIQVRRMR